MEYAANLLDIVSISIHAPREGGDVELLDDATPIYHFNPRPPRGGRHQALCLS